MVIVMILKQISLLFFVAVIIESLPIQDTNSDYIKRFKRDVTVNQAQDATYNVNAEKQLNFNDKEVSATAEISGLKPGGDYKAAEAGIGILTRKGNSFKLSGEHNPKAGSTLAADAKVNLIKTDNTNLNAKASIEKIFPKNEGSVQTKFDGSLDFANKNGVEAILSAKHDSKIGDTFSADGKVNLLKSEKHILDARTTWEREIPLAGAQKNYYSGTLDYWNKNGMEGILSAKHDSTFGDTLSANGKMNILNTDIHKLDAKAAWERQTPFIGGHKDSYSGSLDYLNKQPNSFFKEGSISAQHIPDYADKITASGTANLFHNQNHNLDATGSISRTFPFDSSSKNFNTYRGDLDYLYKDKVGANFGIQRNDLFKTTDYSAMGKFNIFKDKTTDFGAQAGLQRHDTPFMSGSFEPSFGVFWKKQFK